ncbi:MAG TPA: mycothiol synthase [Acidimicrobiales bacterium]|nr:mycothiol synthase [Acidimicrobiales bacterium]
MNGLELAIATAPDGSLLREITALLDDVGRDGGHPALSEHKRIELRRHRDAGAPARAAHTFVGVVARAASRPGLAGYAQVDGDPRAREYAVEMAVAPNTGDGVSIADALLGASVREVAARGGGLLRLWAAAAAATDDERALAAGFELERELVQMRCALPLPRAPDEPPIHTRAFRPGVDEEAWLTTNNRAFASHPEQGRWDLATLLEREREPWFDPEGLRLLEAEGRLAGSCWTKIHDSADPPLGEIYVIGVDPDFQGRGWGRALTRAGLDWLAARGLALGMLYVDAANQPAVSMYRSMGFVEDHVDRAYVTTIEP